MFNWFNTRTKYKAISNSLTYYDEQPEIALPKPKFSEKLLQDALCNRRSIRQYSAKQISLQKLSNLLWSASGVNLKLDNGQMLYTAPTASNHQEIIIYGIDEEGGFVYQPQTHSIKRIFKGDIRHFAGEQEFVGTAPLILCIAAKYSRMVKHNLIKKIRYSRIDAGYVSQNIYLYCASADLATVACGKIPRKLLKNLLKLNNGDVILCHPVGERI